MLSPLPRRSGWAYLSAHFTPSRISLPRKGCRVGLRIVLFEACSAFTRVTACTLALSPMRDTHSEGFSYFVTSIAAPAASGWSVAGWDLHPLESAALPRRTPKADIDGPEIPRENPKLSRRVPAARTRPRGESSMIAHIGAHLAAE